MRSRPSHWPIMPRHVYGLTPIEKRRSGHLKDAATNILLASSMQLVGYSVWRRRAIARLMIGIAPARSLPRRSRSRNPQLQRLGIRTKTLVAQAHATLLLNSLN